MLDTASAVSSEADGHSRQPGDRSRRGDVTQPRQFRADTRSTIFSITTVLPCRRS